MAICSYTSMLSYAQRTTARAVAAALIALPAAADAQEPPLTLRRALEHAGTGAVANRAARAALDEADAGRLATWRAILPSFRVDAGFARTTDPVGAFGTTLRQQRITREDFDPARLNFPNSIDNFTGALVIEQPVVALDGWLASRARARSRDGASFAADWTARTTQVDVVSAWYGVILAAERATTLTAATRAADAHVRQADQMLEAGLVTKSDALLASARAGELEGARLDAVRDSILAGRQLAALLGARAGELPEVRGTFPADSVVERLARDVEALEVRSRADVEGARASGSAAAADVARARATLVPRIVSFARRDLNSAQRPFAGSSNWTVGVMASWSPFSGASELADRRAAEARRAASQAQLAGAEAWAAVDVERTALTLATALSRLAIARRTVEHAQEAHRIVAKKYAGGLATVIELLDAAAAELQTRLALSAARHSLITSLAERLRAIGHDPARLAVLDEPAFASR